MSDQQEGDAAEKLPWYRRPTGIARNVFVLLLVVYGYNFFKDDPPPQDADLVPVFATSTEEAKPNPLAEFASGAAGYKLDDWKRLPVEAREFRAGQKAVLEEFLNKHDRGLALLDALANSDPATWRWPGIDERVSVTATFDGATQLSGMANQLGRTRVVLRARAGEHEAAVRDALRLASMGHELRKRDVSYLPLLISVLVQKAGEDALLDILQEVKDEGLLREAAQTLEPLDFPSEDFIPALRVEYLTLRNAVADFKRGQLPFSSTDLGGVLGGTLFVRPNRTANLHAYCLRPVIAGLEKDWSAGYSAVRAMDRKVDEIQADRVLTFIGGNLGGRFLVCASWPSTNRLLERMAAAAALHRLALVTLALRRHELAHDQTPDTLQALVPAYLSSVPLDPFDNQPLRWNAKEKWLYSVGPNRVDDGGSHTKAKTLKEPDLVMPYRWESKEN